MALPFRISYSDPEVSDAVPMKRELKGSTCSYTLNFPKSVSDAVPMKRELKDLFEDALFHLGFRFQTLSL